MKTRIAAPILAIALASFGALPLAAAQLPAIKKSASNQVPECVTPGRLMAYLKSRHPKLPARYNMITVEYMRHGEDLGIRWDYAFYQMLVETASLKYTGDVRPEQNNFAGLGAVKRGVRGESFKSVSDGVRAHLQHIKMYSGERVENPVAERTRKVQAWKVLDKWQRSIKGPVTYTHLSRKWAPSDRGYTDDIATLASIFNKRFCNGPDPQPELLAAAGATAKRTTTANAGLAKANPKSNATVAKVLAETKKKKATTSAKATPPSTKRPLTTISGKTEPKKKVTAKKKVAVLNAPKADTKKAAAAAKAPVSQKKSEAAKTPPVAKKEKSTQTALNTVQKPNTGTKAPTGKKCRVWTASYGGPKALLIKATKDNVVNYTVLDVNVGKEKREAAAYIAAYAKGGKTMGEFPSPSKALNKAFELCPEG